LLYEALWFNLASPPLDDPAVREALMYAIDRESLVESVVRINNPDAQVLNCGLVAFPGIGPWCDDNEPFASFTYDPQRSVLLLEAAGYDCSNADSGPCTKNGEPLVLPFATTVEDTRRTTGQQLIKDRMVGTGFDISIVNQPASVLFSNALPTGEFTLTEYARGSYDPSVTEYLGCDGIPTADNAFTGGNWNRWCNEEADALMHQADQAFDPEQRADLMAKIYELEAQDFVSLPLYILPEVGAYRSDRIEGPIGDYLGHLLHMYYNANEWSLVNE
jgi:peptide/nickel transport system substrate-binding protein